MSEVETKCPSCLKPMKVSVFGIEVPTNIVCHECYVRQTGKPAGEYVGRCMFCDEPVTEIYSAKVGKRLVCLDCLGTLRAEVGD